MLSFLLITSLAHFWTVSCKSAAGGMLPPASTRQKEREILKELLTNMAKRMPGQTFQFSAYFKSVYGPRLCLNNFPRMLCCFCGGKADNLWHMSTVISVDMSSMTLEQAHGKRMILLQLTWQQRDILEEHKRNHYKCNGQRNSRHPCIKSPVAVTGLNCKYLAQFNKRGKNP